MANKRFDISEGVWRTIGGRRVFIKTGVSLSQAMKDSGKFKKKGYTNEDYQKQEGKISELKKIEREYDNNYRNNNVDDGFQQEKEYLYDEIREAQNKYREMEKNPYVERKYGVNKQELSNLKGINKQQEFNRDDFNKWVNENSDENIRKYEKDTGKDALYNSGDLTKDFSDYEYKLYKRAKENPDSIDPMTENSTDWEALDKKYGSRYKKERDSYESKVFGSDVAKADKQMKDLFGEDFKYDEEKDNRTQKELLEDRKRFEAKMAKNYNDKEAKEFDEKYQRRMHELVKEQDEREKTNDDQIAETAYKQSVGDKKEFLRKMRQDYGWDNEDAKAQYNKLRDENYQDYMSGKKDWNEYEKGIKDAKEHFENFDKKATNISNPTYGDDVDKIMSRYSAGTLKSRYKGTVEYLQQTTNMSGAEILELLKKIENDKR